MKILVTAVHPVGGIRTYFRYVYGDKVFKDCELTFVSISDGLKPFLAQHIKSKSLNIIEVASKKEFLSVVMTALRKGEYDLYHSHGFTAGALLETVRFGRKQTHIMTGHDVMMPAQFTGIKGKLKRTLINYLFSKVSYIHTISDDAEDTLLEFCPGIEKSRVRKILNGIEVDSFDRAEPEPLKRKLNLKSDDFLVGFFGRFMGQKGFRLLVQAVKKLQEEGDRSIHVATFGWGGFIREDYEYLTSLGLAEQFHQLEGTDEMGKALKSVDAVAIPSRWEACPLLPMESLVCGAVTIASDCLGLREVIADTPAIKFENGNVEDLILSIKTARNDQALPESFKAYIPTAKARFDVRQSASALMDYYRDIMSRNDD